MFEPKGLIPSGISFPEREQIVRWSANPLRLCGVIAPATKQDPLPSSYRGWEAEHFQARSSLLVKSVFSEHRLQFWSNCTLVYSVSREKENQIIFHSISYRWRNRFSPLQTMRIWKMQGLETFIYPVLGNFENPQKDTLVISWKRLVWLAVILREMSAYCSSVPQFLLWE